MYSARLTLFTRANCYLCDGAKLNIAKVQKKRTLEYAEVDVLAPGQEKWKKLYQYETPVLHVEPIPQNSVKSNSLAEPKKLWHRFSPEEIEKAINEME